MKGYVPFVTVTKLGMKIISYKIVRPILRLETYFSRWVQQGVSQLSVTRIAGR